MKKQFRDAYNWAVNVQKACLFEPVTAQVETGYCEANHVDGTIKAWTVDIILYSPDMKEMRKAQWCEWEPERFDNQKIEIINYLNSKGIKL